MEAGGPEVRGHPQLHKFEAHQKYKSPCLKIINKYKELSLFFLGSESYSVSIEMLAFLTDLSALCVSELSYYMFAKQ